MDVISISLGISGGWQEDVLSVMADRLVSKGVHGNRLEFRVQWCNKLIDIVAVITASGNSGTSGIFLTASPASGKNVIAVGSTMNAHVPGYILKLIPSSKKKDSVLDITYRTFVNTALTLNATLPIVPTGKEFNQEDDACNDLGDSDKYKNAIVLIHQGGHCDSLTKVKHARSAGAKAVVLYTDTRNATTSFETLSSAVLPIAFINNDDGETIFKAARRSSKKQALKAHFTNTLVAMEAPEGEADSISSFSTLGPTNELQLKPELVAAGGNVFSTVPRYQGSYRFASGTSFSAPYVSASVALFLSNCHQSKQQSPDLVKNVLMNFASPGTDLLFFFHTHTHEIFVINHNYIHSRTFRYYSKRTHLRFTLWRFPYSARCWGG